MNNRLIPVLLLLFILVPLSVPQSVAADPQPYVFTDPIAFFSSKYFQIHAISGTISNDGTNYVTTIHPTVTINIIGEYGDFTFYFSPSEGNTTLEFHIPDCYAGIDIWEGATLKTGTENYTLSVPYVYNNGTVTVSDWKALALATPTGADGTLKRIQLVSNKTEATNLTCRIYYATSPAVGFDGVDDMIKNSHDDYTNYMTAELNFKPFSSGTREQIACVIEKFTLERFNTNYLLGLIWNGSGNIISFTSDAEVLAHQFVHANFTITMPGYDQIWQNGILTCNQSDSNTSFKDVDLGTSIGGYDDASFDGILYNLTLNNGNNVLIINASSFSPSSTTVVDFSGAGNHGTAYGGAQYKVYTGTGFQATLTFTPDTHYTLTFTNVSYPTVAPSYSPVTITGSILLNGSVPTLDNWVDANIPIYNATHVILPVTITQSGETLPAVAYVSFNGSLSLSFLTVQKPYNNQYILTFEPTYSTLTLPDPLSFYISSPYITFYGFTIYSSTASPTGLGYLSSTGKLQLLASGNLTIVQPSGVQPPDHILINGVPYHSWSYSLDDNSISLTVPATQYTVTVYYKSDITATISIIFAAITLMTTVLIVLAAFLILAFLRQSQNPTGTNISLSYETGAAITVIATILIVGTLIISAIWSAI